MRTKLKVKLTKKFHSLILVLDFFSQKKKTKMKHFLPIFFPGAIISCCFVLFSMECHEIRYDFTWNGKIACLLNTDQQPTEYQVIEMR